jgi:hypothetical protein
LEIVGLFNSVRFVGDIVGGVVIVPTVGTGFVPEGNLVTRAPVLKNRDGAPEGSLLFSTVATVG